MIKGIEHIGIAAKNSTVLKDWYVDVFGMTVTRDNGKGGYFIADKNGTEIEIYPAEREERSECSNLTAGIRHIAFAVDNFDAEYKKLKEKNVEFVGEPIIKEKYSNLFFKDIEGNLLHIIERR